MRWIPTFTSVCLLVTPLCAQELKNCDNLPLATQPQCLQDNIAALSRQLGDLAKQQGSDVADKARIDLAIQTLAGQIASISARIDDLRAKLKVVTIGFCSGEYTPADCGGTRYDPRDNTLDVMGDKECHRYLSNFSKVIVKIREQGGGCCGYGWYSVTCTGY
jgi:hypothetical protein